MRSFNCGNCGQLVFFENTACLHCEARLGFRWSDRELITLEPAGGHLRQLGSGPSSPLVMRCANTGIAGCNGLVTAEGLLCESCELTRTRPADEDLEGIERLKTAEAAKRRLLFGLGELGLIIRSRARDPQAGLAFDFLSSSIEPVTTGHANGVITIDLAETHDAQREERRLELGEPYRTMLGHLRHEASHWYFTVLLPEGPLLESARELFGDERADYSEALERHYQSGPPSNWADQHVSAYATMHPSEDWAETFAQYLHICDTLQTAVAFDLAVANTGIDLRLAISFSDLLGAWLPLSYALNAVNRSMGHDDLYPFVLSEAVIRKLGFVHDLVSGRAAQASSLSSVSASP